MLRFGARVFVVLLVAVGAAKTGRKPPAFAQLADAGVFGSLVGGLLWCAFGWCDEALGEAFEGSSSAVGQGEGDER